MQKEITVNNKTIAYTLKKSARARRMRITIRRDATVAVTIPRRGSAWLAEQFVRQKAAWIIPKVEFFEKSPTKSTPGSSRKEFMENKAVALALAREKVDHFAKLYGFTYGKISIRNQKTQWGSCSRAGNLSFNYKIALLPERLADYIIVHELCHRAEMNHSDRFWNLVAKTIPNHRELRRELRGVTHGS